MNAIFSLFASLSNAARAFDRLAAAVDAVSGECERRVEVIGHTQAAPVPQLTAEPQPAVNGTAESTRKRR